MTAISTPYTQADSRLLGQSRKGVPADDGFSIAHDRVRSGFMDASLMLGAVRRLTIPSGPLEGDRFGLHLQPFQSRFIARAFAAGTRQGFLSVPRGNAKSTLGAAIAAAAFLAPRYKAGGSGEVVLAAQSFSQARGIGRDSKAMIRGLLGADWFAATGRAGWLRVRDNAQTFELEDAATGSRLVARGAREDLLHGAKVALVVFDELGVGRGDAEQRFRTLTGALGKIEGARVLGLGTRPREEEHWYERLLSGGSARGAFPAEGRYVQVHAAAAKANIWHRRTWWRCNPLAACSEVLAAEIAGAAAEARDDPSAEADFRYAKLNQGFEAGVEDSNLLIGAARWRPVLTDELPPAVGPWVGGLDLGGTAALSALAALWPETGRVEVLVMAGSEPSPAVRGRRDGVGGAYVEAVRSGELLLSAGLLPRPDELLRAAVERWGLPAALAADRYRQGEVFDALNRAMLPEEFGLDLRGLGFLHANEDVRAFRRAVFEDRIAVSRGAKLLTRSVAGARTLSDPAGNVKLAVRSQAGRRKRHRDDAAVALVLACGLAARYRRAAA